MKLPKIIIVRKYQIIKMGDYIVIGGSKIGAYDSTKNIIYLSVRYRWAIVHELLHWWGRQVGGEEHWLNKWLDKPGYSKRVKWIGF